MYTIENYKISIIDTEQQKLVDKGSPYCNAPSYGNLGLIESNSNMIYVTNQDKYCLDVINLENGKIEQQIIMEQQPTEITVDQSTNMIYAMNDFITTIVWSTNEVIH